MSQSTALNSKHIPMQENLVQTSLGCPPTDLSSPYKLSLGSIPKNSSKHRSCRTIEPNTVQDSNKITQKLVKDYEKDWKITRKRLETYSFFKSIKHSKLPLNISCVAGDPEIKICMTRNDSNVHPYLNNGYNKGLRLQCKSMKNSTNKNMRRNLSSSGSRKSCREGSLPNSYLKSRRKKTRQKMKKIYKDAYRLNLIDNYIPKSIKKKSRLKDYPVLAKYINYSKERREAQKYL
ncbi:unnamed protein product [Moneuplotes crassus]|uniref:Uncharacterized protein n=1 Tax=Euplotes crassus TaxID=5936 RepID=A0AAD1XRK5_EUPCR|nr:unnamed protein product [Moneuplotes crassus]